jgi:glycosyltransferase involved in cell wall biosynthesis
VYLVPGHTGGMETYARELIPRLVAERPDWRFTAFVNREAEADGLRFENVVTTTLPVRATRRVDWVRGEQQHLPRLARRAGVDLLHSLASTAPACGRFARVVTIHDLIYRLYPEAHFGLRTLGLRVLVPLAARRSHRIITDSRSARDDLVRLLDVPPGKVDVVPLGTGTSVPGEALAVSEIRARYRLGHRPLLLTLSAKRPVKNLARLLDALALMPAERRPVLVAPGYPTPHENELRRRAGELGLGQDVRFAAWVGGAELEGLFHTAAGFVFPSLYEGFGLPVLEAMRRGVPVACSNRASLAEVSGDAAIHFDPEDARDIAGALERLLSAGPETERLRALGRERAAGFSWEHTARGTIATYERTLSAR